MSGGGLGRVLVDARALHASGIGRYLRELLAHWLAEPPFAALTLLGEPSALGPLLEAHPSALPTRVVPYRGAMYGAAAQWAWWRTGRAEARGADAVFFPHWDAPAAAFPRAGVVTVHDLTQFRAPEGFGAARRAVARPVLGRVVRSAARVVCVSRAAAGDVAAEFPGAAPKLRVVPNGVSARFAAPDPGAPPCAGRYLLWVGNLKPHKNPHAALDVLARLRAGGRADLSLAFAGRAFGGLDVRALARDRGVEEAVVVLGEVDDARLHALYAHAGALLFPSRFEGFGLPVAEAMAAGAPVVASNAAAVAEVVGAAAPVFAPDDVAGMAAEAAKLLDDPVHRAGAVARGRDRARALSWRAAATATADVLAEAAAVRDGAGPHRSVASGAR